MDRKNFINTAASLVAGATIPFSMPVNIIDEEQALYRIPPYLKPGNTIGITSPAGAITAEQLQPAIAVMKSWGYKIKTGNSIGKKDFTFGGTDQERLDDLQQMLDDINIQAIMCARGGYGSIRIVDKINWTKFNAKPKWLIGFSDVTVLHNHIHTNCKIASIHSKMTNSFPMTGVKGKQFKLKLSYPYRMHCPEKTSYSTAGNPQNKPGVAEGILVGGNLKTIENLAGSLSDIKTDGKLLFVEDTGEYLYSIDRMFWNLQRTGKLKNLKGLIVGGFKVKPDDAGEEFGRTVQDIVLEKVKNYKYPVCFDFPVGHQKANFALKCGVLHKLTVHINEISLVEKS